MRWGAAADTGTIDRVLNTAVSRVALPAVQLLWRVRTESGRKPVGSEQRANLLTTLSLGVAEQLTLDDGNGGHGNPQANTALRWFSQHVLGEGLDTGQQQKAATHAAIEFWRLLKTRALPKTAGRLVQIRVTSWMSGLQRLGAEVSATAPDGESVLTLSRSFLPGWYAGWQAWSLRRRIDLPAAGAQRRPRI